MQNLLLIQVWPPLFWGSVVLNCVSAFTAGYYWGRYRKLKKSCDNQPNKTGALRNSI